MTEYKLLFKIHKELLKQSMPDDLIPIFFDYLGKLDETADDLINKRCFHSIHYEHPSVFIKTALFGHYCSVCDKIYMIFAPHQFTNHCKSKIHHTNLKNNKYIEPNDIRIRQLVYNKHPKMWQWKPKLKERTLKTIKYKNITLDQN